MEPVELMELMGKNKEKGIIQTILDNHRDVAIYDIAMTNILLFLIDETDVLPNFENPMLNEVSKEITRMKSRLQKLENAKDNPHSCGNHAPNP